MKEELELEQSQGYLKLKESVVRDCNEYCSCFNPNGCNVPNAQIGEYGKDGFKRCFHNYCDKFNWIIERAKHYAEKLNMSIVEVLDSWEKNRDYWYMNYYQDANQPLLSENVKVFETMEDFKKSVSDKGFRCPYCNGVSTNPSKCDSGLNVKLINSKKGKKDVCNWSAGGLFRTAGKGSQIYIKEHKRNYEIFYPVAWEA